MIEHELFIPTFFQSKNLLQQLTQADNRSWKLSKLYLQYMLYCVEFER